jgi:hypothetical protein
MTISDSGKDTMYISKLNPELQKTVPSVLSRTVQQSETHCKSLKCITEISEHRADHSSLSLDCVKCGYMAKFYSDVIVKEWQTPGNKNSKSGGCLNLE